VVIPGGTLGALPATTRSAVTLRLARQITARHDLDDVLAETFRALRPMMPFAGGSIQLLDDDGWIQVVAADPVQPAHLMAERVPLATSLAGRIILTEQPVYVPDRDEGGSYLGVPLVADGAAIGVLQVHSPERDAWSDEQRELFVSVAPVVSAAIQNARAYARAAAARAHAHSAWLKLHEAQQLVMSLQIAHRRGDQVDLAGLLARLTAVLDEPDVTPLPVPVPAQRLAVS